MAVVCVILCEAFLATLTQAIVVYISDQSYWGALYCAT